MVALGNIYRGVGLLADSADFTQLSSQPKGSLTLLPAFFLFQPHQIIVPVFPSMSFLILCQKTHLFTQKLSELLLDNHLFQE